MVDKPKLAAAADRGERIIAILILFVMTKPFFSRPGVSPNLTIDESGPSGNFLFALAYGTTIVLLARQGRISWRAGKADLLLGVLVLFTVLSALWSIDPYITFRNSLYLVATSLVGVYLSARYSRSEQIQLAATALAIAAVFSLLLSLTFPDYGVHGSQWRGVFQHKNTLGRTMALAMVAFVSLAFQRPPWRWLGIVGAALAGVLIVKAGSGTAVVVVVLMAVLLPLYTAMGKHVYFAIAVTSLAILLGGTVLGLFLTNPHVVLDLLQKDTTLTGRTQLWDAVSALIMRQPWLGYGYQAFWFGDEGEIRDVWRAAGWEAGGAHNGFLEVALGMGVVALAVFCCGFLLSFRRALLNLRAGGIEAIWPALLLSFFLAYNFTESSVLLTHSILWVLYVTTTLSLHQMPLPDNVTRAPFIRRRVVVPLAGKLNRADGQRDAHVPRAWGRE